MIAILATFSAIVLFCAYALRLLVSIAKLKNHNLQTEDGNLLNEKKSSETETLRRDCDLETVYSMDDAQCANVCKTTGTYRTKNGVCVNVLIFETQAVQNRCSPKDGLLAYLVGDPTFGKTKAVCLSIDLGVRPDDLNKPNIICRDGNINVDYTKNFPLLKDCDCGDRLLTIVESTSTIRTHGICMDRRIKPVVELNDLLYKYTV